MIKKVIDKNVIVEGEIILTGGKYQSQYKKSNQERSGQGTMTY